MTLPRSAGRLLLAGLAALSAGCHPYGMRGLKPAEQHITRNAIFIDNDGHALEPFEGRRAREFTDSMAFARYLGGMMAGIRADTVRRDGMHKLLIRIHGGLNTLNGGLDASLAMNDSIRSDAVMGYYPIFINWESGLISSYGEHLLFARRGQNYPLAAGLPLAPLYLAADLGEGVMRFPLTSLAEFKTYSWKIFRSNQSEASSARTALKPQPEVAQSATPRDIAEKRERILTGAAPASTQAGVTRPLPPGGPATSGSASELTYSRFAYHRSRGEVVQRLGASLLYLVPPNVEVAAYRHWVQRRSAWEFSPTWAAVLGWIPLKSAAMFLVDALGTPSWDIMHRRTRALFRDPNSFGSQQDTRGYVPPSGALARLLDSLQALIREDTATRYELTIVGHSMGAIVANEIARTRDSLAIANLVFMAGAVSLREFETGALPYLQSHTGTEFYSLSLHPLAEAREHHFFRIPPSGSLLEWIDSYYSRPETDFDRMLGKYDNIMQASFMFPADMRGRVHIKSFGYRDLSGCGPNRALPFEHGQFNDISVPFWRPAFWHPGERGCEEIKAMKGAP
jgi:hypothetical protein